jgi:hypothetical protein
MELNIKLNVMMGTHKMEMDVVVLASFSQAGLVSMAHPFKKVSVFIPSLILQF